MTPTSITPRTIKLTLEYDGTKFNGWQFQSAPNRTVQGEIETAIKKITGEKVRVLGSGRTDSGVHALGQVAHFRTKSKIPLPTLLKALNYHLPDDISIVETRQVRNSFHAQFSAKSKIYRYTVLNRAAPSAYWRSSAYQYPYPLNLAAMKREAKDLVGRKDFKSFQVSDPHGPEDKSTVRIIKKLSIQKKGDFIYFDIEANGFLYKMVRSIVGTLLDAGSGRLPKGGVKKILTQKSRAAASTTAPAWGLCLLKVKY